MKATLSVISGVVFVIAFVPYIIAILRKETQPSKMSWLIWAILDTITFAGMYIKGVVNGQIVGAILGSWIVVALAMKYGTKGWTRLDMFCLFGAFMSLVLWKIFGDATFGIATSAVVVFLGAIPTFVSAWNDPSKEDKLAWTIYWISCVIAMLAIPVWTTENVVQPLSFTIIETDHDDFVVCTPEGTFLCGINEHLSIWRNDMTRSINLHGLTSDQVRDRWINDLSEGGQEDLVREACADIEFRKGDNPLLLNPSALSYCNGGKTYEEMCGSLMPENYPGLLDEIHRRLAGGARPDGKTSSPHTASLLR